MLSQLIALLKYCELKNLQPVVRFTNPLYANHLGGDYDWFRDFFECVREIPSYIINRLSFSDIRGQGDYHFVRQDDDFSILEAHNLYKNFFRIKPGVIKKAEDFAEMEFSGDVLGVHYRGTDKKYEAPAVEYSAMEKFIDRVINKIGQEAAAGFRIFVATDDVEFITYLKSTKFNDKILYFGCTELAVDGRPVHLSPGDNYRKGVEALSIIYLLSRCTWCVKTASQLSAWAVIFNPNLKIFTPQKPFAHYYHFPDKQMWENRESL